MTALSDRLAARTLELVDIPSQSEDERAIREHLLTLVPSTHETEFAGDEAFLFVPERRAGVPLVVLAGHYDTVPAQGNLPGSIDGGVVHGLGSSDMKGGLAVALELVRDLPRLERTAVDVALLLFGREELPAERNPLPALFEGSRVVHDAALAILLEPTSGRIQAGCLGNVVARLTFRGRSGHASRPWLADSALERAVAGLRPLLEVEPREASVAGLTFVEVVSVTRLESGIADNVIPGEATATVSFRYAPDRSAEEAETYLRTLVPEGAELEIVGNSPAARVATDSELVAALRAAGHPEIEPKQAWTNVADFTARGIDAVNLGPGDPAFAHRADEQVAASALVDVYETLRRFVMGAVREDAS